MYEIFQFPETDSLVRMYLVAQHKIQSQET